MTARILVVDDIKTNVKLLEARLMAEYFQVLTAFNGRDTLDICENGLCDIVLLDVMMPEMDGFEVCRRLKSNPKTMYIPVIMVTALDQPEDRMRGLEAGAEDFLTKPVNDLALITRVKSLVRLKLLTDELRLRASTGREMGIEGVVDISAAFVAPEKGKIIIIDDRPSSSERLARILSVEHHVLVVPNANDALFRAADEPYDLALISLALEDFDALRLCAQMRSLERTRLLPILVVADADNEAGVMRALDLGVNDYVRRPVDATELLARVRTQVRRKRYNEVLRDSVQQTIEMAVTDSLSGLHNRRYLDSHLAAMFDRAIGRARPLSMMICDLDHFKSVNDEYGHDVGDEVIREFALRLRKSVRNIDMACRYGGEEFVVVMPDTDITLARLVAERIRDNVAGEPFVIGEEGLSLTVTASLGISTLEGEGDTPEKMLKRADVALYNAKRAGRNMVATEAA